LSGEQLLDHAALSEELYRPAGVRLQFQVRINSEALEDGG
jgi:hypothetical protein